jgi:hypothetical protein
VPAFLVFVSQTGPEWEPDRPMEEQSLWPEHAVFMNRLVDEGLIALGGPLHEQGRAFHVWEEVDSEEAIRAELAADPWHESHLIVESIQPVTLALDGRE